MDAAVSLENPRTHASSLINKKKEEARESCERFERGATDVDASSPRNSSRRHLRTSWSFNGETRFYLSSGLLTVFSPRDSLLASLC